MEKHSYYSLIYNIAVSNYGKKSILARLVGKYYRWLCADIKDLSVLSELNGQPFYFPFTHKLPFHMKIHPLYDKQLPKLCNYMQETTGGGKINIIDVGANVGDTVINIGLKDAFYLCIEGDANFSKYIEYNLEKYNYSLENVFLSDTDVFTSYNINAHNGTGHLEQSSDSDKNLQLITLDKLLEEKYPQLKIDLLKVDTDGFDFKVIRGAKRTIKKYLPLLFFEWDKFTWTEQGEDPCAIFQMLDELGYSKCIVFDNKGNLIDKVLSADNASLKRYIDNTQEHGPISYYDVLAIPELSIFNAEHLFSLFHE